MCPVPKCSGLLIKNPSLPGEKATWKCVECDVSFDSKYGPDTYEQPQFIPEHEENAHHHEHDEHGHCCDGHHHHHDKVEEMVNEEHLQPTKIHKDGKVEGFDPGKILHAARKSYDRGMAAYTEKKIYHAFMIFDHHVRVFESGIGLKGTVFEK